MPLIWTRLAGIGEHVDPSLIPSLPADRGPFRPDLPKSFYDAGGMARADPSALCRDLLTDQWFGQHILLDVLQEHVKLIPVECIVPDRDVPERTLLMVEMVRRKPRERAAWFDAMSMPGQAQRRTVKDVLLQATARGLEPLPAQAVLERLQLPSAKQAEGVDDEVVNAYVKYAQRTIRRPAIAPRGGVANAPITEDAARAGVLTSIRAARAEA